MPTWPGLLKAYATLHELGKETRRAVVEGARISRYFLRYLTQSLQGFGRVRFKPSHEEGPPHALESDQRAQPTAPALQRHVTTERARN